MTYDPAKDEISDIEGLRKLERQLNLSAEHAIHLFKLLNYAKFYYKARVAVAETSNKALLIAELKIIMNAANRIDVAFKYGSDGHRGALLAQFENGGWTWLSDQYRGSSPPASEAITARNFVKNWAAQADKVRKILCLAIQGVRLAPNIKQIVKSKNLFGTIPPQEWLYGVELPRIFKQITSRPYKISLPRDGADANSDCVDFVNAVNCLFELQQLKPETLKSHFSRARKRSKAERKGV